jgi:hypothetical protein
MHPPQGAPAPASWPGPVRVVPVSVRRHENFELKPPITLQGYRLMLEESCHKVRASETRESAPCPGDRDEEVRGKDRTRTREGSGGIMV